jgi:hypothetical protein
MNVEEYEWIGIVYPEDVKATVTLVTPLAYFSEGEWKPLARDARRQWFPSNGKAARFTEDFSGTSNSRLCLFRPQLNTQLSASLPGNSRYFIAHELKPAPLAQVLDWTARVKNTLDIPDLLAQGIDAQDCFCQRVYIYCQSRLFGPIRVELDNSRYKPREYIQSSNTGGQPLFVWMYTLPEGGVLLLDDIPSRLLFLDESMLDTPTGKEDWSLPQVTIKQVLLASNEALADIEDNVHLVDKRIRELARLSSKEGPHALHLDPVILKRAQYLLSSQTDRLHDLQDILAQLSDEHPIIKTARKLELQARSQEIEQEAIALIQEKQEQLQQLNGTIQAAQEHLNHLQADVEELQRSQQQAVMAMSAFEQTVHERLATLKDEPLRILAEHHITASLLPMLQDGSMQPAYELQIPSPYSPAAHASIGAPSQKILSISGLEWHTPDEAEAIQDSLHVLQLQRWRQIARQSGVNSKDVRICIAALLAGLVPVLDGDAAIPVLRTVAQILACGRATIVPVPLSALSTLDLFGTIDQYQQSFIPSNGLADCILEAQAHPDDLVVVILEGINRVPGMTTYVPFLRQYAEARQAGPCASNNAPLPLFHPRAIAMHDPYLPLARFTWPGNVLLTATVDSDLNNLPLPAICDRWIVNWETILKDGAAPSRKVSPVHSYIPAQLWNTWRNEVYADSENNKEYRSPLNHRQKLLYTALTSLDIKDEDILDQLIWPDQSEQAEEEGK